MSTSFQFDPSLKRERIHVQVPTTPQTSYERGSINVAGKIPFNNTGSLEDPPRDSRRCTQFQLRLSSRNNPILLNASRDFSSPPELHRPHQQPFPAPLTIFVDLSTYFIRLLTILVTSLSFQQPSSNTLNTLCPFEDTNSFKTLTDFSAFAHNKFKKYEYPSTHTS
jgi:hypothetical protein